MKSKLTLVSLLLFSLNSFAFVGHDNFKINRVVQNSEYGYKALGVGKNVAEINFDCAQVSEIGLVLKVTNNYGKTSSFVIPSHKLGANKNDCKKNLQKYFAGVYFNRGVASSRKLGEEGTIEMNFSRGGFFSGNQSRSLVLK